MKGELERYCASKAHAEREYKLDWEATLYKIDGKIFALFGHDRDGKEILTVKLNPADGQVLRERFEDVTPGYHMNKVHWNSVDMTGTVPLEVIHQMIDDSHALIFGSLSKKRQRELAGS